jgi:hypothetical protein
MESRTLWQRVKDLEQRAHPASHLLGTRAVIPRLDLRIE